MSGKLYLLFNHKLMEDQTADAYKTLKIDEIIYLPKELLEIWSNIPAEEEHIGYRLEEISQYFTQHLKAEDYVLIQGDFGATYLMVQKIIELGAKALYATTKREAVEKIINGKHVKTSTFKHIRFREYGR